MERRLVVILGAGFSANADMPTASAIAERFNRDLRRKLLSASSSEWMWEDNKTDIDKHNWRLNSDHLAYSYIFNELVKEYVAREGSFVYYEDFYQYIIDNFKDNSWVERIFERARKILIKDLPHLTSSDYYKRYLFTFDHKQFQLVNAILNYLIGDILDVIPKSDEELITIYKPFVQYIQSYDKVNIFTLNHDLLLERIFRLAQISYSVGFNTENSSIYYKDQPVPVFDNNFKASVKIHKLHGSIDFFKFLHFEQSASFISYPTGEYDYYQTTDYHVKHSSVRVNSETRKVIQNFNFDVVPKFITGTKKTETIQGDFLFKNLYSNFEKAVLETEDLFVSGYSFSDKHVDRLLNSKKFNFINHNKSKAYPFQGEGKNIKSLHEISKCI